MPGSVQRLRGTRSLARRLAPGSGEAGLTLIELIVAFSLMLILSLMALPVARVRVQREKEQRLRHGLIEIRTAIDRHKDMADEGNLGMLDPDNFGYPTSLDDLVSGVPINQQPGGTAGIGLEPSRAMRMDAGQGRDPIGRVGANLGQGSAFGDRNRSGLDDPFRDGGDFERADRPEMIPLPFGQIPVDPMTGQREWGMLSVSDEPEGRSWSGRNVFDVYSLSNGIALDGTRYSEW